MCNVSGCREDGCTIDGKFILTIILLPRSYGSYSRARSYSARRCCRGSAGRGTVEAPGQQYDRKYIYDVIHTDILPCLHRT